MEAEGAANGLWTQGTNPFRIAKLAAKVVTLRDSAFDSIDGASPSVL
jgi:hypothetical protein